MLSLCVSKKNLEINLQHHLLSSKHLQAVEQTKTGKKHDPFSLVDKEAGLPSLLGLVYTQINLILEDGERPSLLFLRMLLSTTLILLVRHRRVSVLKPTLLSSLCWGFRGPNCIYDGVSYSVIELLNDLHVGGTWYLEPHLSASSTRRLEVNQI